MPVAPRLSRAARRPSVASCLLALALLATALPAASGERAPFPSRVHPLMLLELDDEWLRFSALGRDWEIALAPRTVLSPAARAELGDVSLPRFLGGRVVGDEDSWVRVARGDGRLSGHLFTDDTLYRLEPPSGGDGYRLVLVGGDLVGTDAAGSPIDPRPDADGAPLEASPRVRAGPPLVSRALRVGIVVDSRYDERSGGRGLARALGIMNGVDGLYRDQLGLAVVVERVRLHDDPATDPMRSRGGTVEEVLGAFRDVRRGDPGLPDDLALVHLFSGHEDPRGVIGLGWIDTVCRLDGYDVSMSTPFPYDALLSAHEIAHNLGARHDEDASCRVAGGAAAPPGLMEERMSSTTASGFSTCSLERLRASLDKRCLVDSLDLALDVRVSPDPDARRRSVAVRVANADPWRTARAVRTRTRFPTGTRLAEASAGCTVDGTVLVCEHGDVAPGASGTITVLATLAGDGATDGATPGRDGELVATIEPGRAVDSDPGNDRVAIDLHDPEGSAADRRTAPGGRARVRTGPDRRAV